MMKVRLYAHTLALHAHEYIIGMVAIADSPHFILYACIAATGLCVCIGLLVYLQEGG